MIVPNLEELVSEAEQACNHPYVPWLVATRKRLSTLSVDYMPLHVIRYWFDTTMPNNLAPIHDSLWNDVQYELSLLPKRRGADYYSRETVLKAIDILLYVVGTGS